MATGKVVSEVIVRVIETPDKKFKGQIKPPDDVATNTPKTESRDIAIKRALDEARDVLQTDNIVSVEELKTKALKGTGSIGVLSSERIPRIPKSE